MTTSRSSQSDTSNDQLGSGAVQDQKTIGTRSTSSKSSQGDKHKNDTLIGRTILVPYEGIDEPCSGVITAYIEARKVYEVFYSCDNSTDEFALATLKKYLPK